MKQIEIITDDNYINLQNAVNAFLEKKDNTIKVKDIKLSSSMHNFYCLYSIMIIYDIV